MNAIIDFLIRASISLSVLYLVYWFFLREVTLFRVIRYYLIFSMILSVLLPCIRIRYEVELPFNEVIGDNNGVWGHTGFIGSLGGITHTGMVGKVLGSIYFMGVAFFLARLIWQVAILLTSIHIKFPSHFFILYSLIPNI